MNKYKNKFQKYTRFIVNNRLQLKISNNFNTIKVI